MGATIGYRQIVEQACAMSTEKGSPTKNNPVAGHAGRAGEEAPGLRPYSTPKLTCFGKVADLTAGGSIGVGDSGNFASQKPFA